MAQFDMSPKKSFRGPKAAPKRQAPLVLVERVIDGASRELRGATVRANVVKRARLDQTAHVEASADYVVRIGDRDSAPIAFKKAAIELAKTGDLEAAFPEAAGTVAVVVEAPAETVEVAA